MRIYAGATRDIRAFRASGVFLPDFGGKSAGRKFRQGETDFGGKNKHRRFSNPAAFPPQTQPKPQADRDGDPGRTQICNLWFRGRTEIQRHIH